MDNLSSASQIDFQRHSAVDAAEQIVGRNGEAGATPRSSNLHSKRWNDAGRYGLAALTWPADYEHMQRAHTFTLRCTIV